MYRDLQNHKRSDRIKWIAVFLAILLLAVAVCAMFTRGFKTINPYCWGDKHTYGDDGICINCGAEKSADEDKKGTADNGGMAMGDSVGNGIMLLNTDIPRKLYSDYGIAPIAESAKQLTATITPTDATNKVVDWSVAWKNANSTWAKGKTVTSYVTVTPTSDGALTANVQCLKAFSEQVIVTVAVRNAEDINATCTVDYVQKALGFDISVTYGTQTKILDLKYTSTDVTIDFPFQITSGASFQQAYILTWGAGPERGKSLYKIGYNLNLSEDYTISVSQQSFFTVSFAPTSAYISALSSAGVSTSGMSADTYSKSFNANTSDLDMTDMFYLYCDSFGSVDATCWANYQKLRSNLKSKTSSVMLKVKCETGTTDGKTVSTIYNIKFSTTSLTALANGVELSSSGIQF